MIIGAGFIGLEVAAAARKAGNRVTVLEALPAPLTRVFGDVIGSAFAAVHDDAGVDVRCGVTVASITDDAVVLGDGSEVPADVVVVGIGAEPVVDWLADSNLTLNGGVVVDATLAAGPPLVYAAGMSPAGPTVSSTMSGCGWSTGRTRRSRAPTQRRTCSPRPPVRSVCPTWPCRSYGATSITIASSTSGMRPATTRARSSLVPSTIGASWPCTTGAACYARPRRASTCRSS